VSYLGLLLVLVMPTGTTLPVFPAGWWIDVASSRGIIARQHRFQQNGNEKSGCAQG
jgi:hypothetical protein